MVSFWKSHPARDEIQPGPTDEDVDVEVKERTAEQRSEIPYLLE